MAISENATPESEAKRWFMLAIVGAFLFAAAVFVFVLGRDVEPRDTGNHVKFERPAAPAHSHEEGGEHHGHTH